MLQSYSDDPLEHGRLDLSFSRTQLWAPHSLRGDTRVNMVTLGDAERGPMILMLNKPPFLQPIVTRDGFGEKFIHLHPSDGLRLVVGGDFQVGRERYEAGEARLQAGGAYYGPEGFGPKVCAGGLACWVIVAFLDRRGCGMYLANPAGQPIVDELEDDIAPVYSKLGVITRLGADQSYSAVAAASGDANQELRISTASPETWETIAGVRVQLLLGGAADLGPIIVALRSEPGKTAAPAGTYGTELMLVVTNGWCTIEDRVYRQGDILVSQANVPAPRAVAGPEGAGVYLMFGDRSRLAPRAAPGDPGSAEWGRWLTTTTQRLIDRLGEAAVAPVSPRPSHPV